MINRILAAVAVGSLMLLTNVSRAQSTQPAPATKPAMDQDVTQGALRVSKPDGSIVECPLKHTDVKADIAGFIARVKVTQTFHNPTNEKIEAVYVFPLPHEAAVDDMTMVLGQRRIVGLIKKRAEARQIYEQALSAGQQTALLEQERPNIFTQSVGNIEPGQEIRIEISYVDVLKYDMGTYEFHFPMVVGPRYNPGAPISTPPSPPAELQGKVSPAQPDTTRVPDASKISPPVLKPGFRNGHDVSLSVNLNAGVPIQDLKTPNHEMPINFEKGAAQASMKLPEADSIPNKDFILRYGVVGKKPEMAVLAHTGDAKAATGYFMLMVQPKEDERLTKSPPREMVFLVDVSGSMSGAPTDKVIDAMREMLKLCREIDTVQVITFASNADKLFEKPVPVNAENIKKALKFTDGLRGGGGTEMLKGVKLAIDEPVDAERVRIVVMLTDGYIGNEAQIIEHVGKNCGDKVRFWCVGIGQAPNMMLIDGVAKQGGGMGKKLALGEEARPISQEIMTRIQRAQLAKVKIDWGGLEVRETYPAKIPELWAGRPIILYGLFGAGATKANITISGEIEGQLASWPLAVNLPAAEPKNDVLAKVWARQKIEDLMQQTYYQGSPEVEELVTGIALDYRLMSQYTSFVAVDEKEAGKITPQATPPRRMMVPVPLPEGTRWEGFFGPAEGEMGGNDIAALGLAAAMPTTQPAMAGAPREFAPYALKGKSSGAFYGRAGANQLQSGRWTEERKLGGDSYTAITPRLRAAVPAGPAAGQGTSSGFKWNSSMNAEFATMADKDIGWARGGDGRLVSAITGDGQALVKAGAEALKQAEELKAKDLAAARQAALRGYMLDSAAANIGQSAGETAAKCLELIEKIRAAQVKNWSAGPLGHLNTKLDIVIRDKSVAEALAMIDKSAEIVPGSLDDAAALLGHKDGKELRITYLDLRGATVAQALDWMLMPLKLSWWEAKDHVVVGTDRRQQFSHSPWVYDVSAIALPLADEIKNDDYQKSVEAAKKLMEQFKSVFTAELHRADRMQETVAWYAPGQLLVIGSPEGHAAAAKLIAELADPKATFRGGAADLHKLTIKRYVERKEAIEKRQAAMERLRVAQVHDEFSWRLLAAAADGKTDDEAATELLIAWNSPATAELLKNKGGSLIFRSAWAVMESDRLRPNRWDTPAPLPAAASVHLKTADEALAALEKSPEDPPAFATALYATLAKRDDAGFVKKALPLLTTSKAENSPLAPARVLAKALLGDPKAIDRKALEQVLAAGVSGEDMTVLLALACRRAGGETWEQFRARQKELLGNQPLDGAVIVLINRLATPKLPMLAGK